MGKQPLFASAAIVALVSMTVWVPTPLTAPEAVERLSSESLEEKTVSGGESLTAEPVTIQAAPQSTSPAPRANMVRDTAPEEAGDWFVADARVPASARAELQQTEPAGSTQHRYAALDADAALSALVSAGELVDAEPGERTVINEEIQLDVTLFDGEVAEIRVDEIAVTRPLESSGAPLVEVLGTHLDDGDERSASFAFVADSDGDYSLRGQIEDESEDVTAIQEASDDVYRIDSVDVASLGLPDNAEDAVPAPDEPVAPVAAEEPAAGGESAVVGVPTAASAPVVTAAAASIYNLDIIVGYLIGSGGNILSEIGAQIAQTNQALLRSEVNSRLVLVETRALNAYQSSDMHNDLEAMRMGGGPYQDLRNRREYLGSDLVALVVPNSTSNACGIAYLPQPHGSPSGAYSVTARQCFSNLTMLHEIGHNLGGSHNIEAGTGAPYPFAFSAGHAVPGVARDIMAYACAGNSCPRMPQYANPNLVFFGIPGVRSGVAGRSDVARSFNQMAPIIANYRSRPQPLTEVTPNISGSVIVGATLTANPGAWGPAPVTFTYQWLRNGQAIPGATQATYALLPTDALQEIRVNVTGSKPGYRTATRASAGVTIVGVLTSRVPTITGAPEVGKTLTAVPGAWSPAPVSFTYQWLVDGTPIPGATAATYVTKPGDLEKTITVTAIGKKTGYSSAASTSAGTFILRSLNGVTPTVSGTAIAGLTLTGTVGTWGPDPVTLSYQWLRNGQAIGGTASTTATTYLLGPEDVGQDIQFQVTGVKPGYATQARNSVPIKLKAELPTGNYDRFELKNGIAKANGWSLDPDMIGAVEIHAYRDGKWVGTFFTGTTRPDVQSVFPNHGTQNGFEIVMPASGGNAPLCLYAINKQGGANTGLGCRNLVTAGPPIGYFDSAVGTPGGADIRGWALDPDTSGPIPVHVYVDGRGFGAFTADRERLDVGQIYPKFGPNHGYFVNLRGLSPGQHDVCVYAIDQYGPANQLLGCRKVQSISAEPIGRFDSLQALPGGEIRGRGWAFQPGYSPQVPIHVYRNGQWYATITANTSRPDVGAAYPGTGPNRGFEFTANGPGEYCVYAISSASEIYNQRLGCRTI